MASKIATREWLAARKDLLEEKALTKERDALTPAPEPAHGRDREGLRASTGPTAPLA